MIFQHFFKLRHKYLTLVRSLRNKNSCLANDMQDEENSFMQIDALEDDLLEWHRCSVK